MCKCLQGCQCLGKYYLDPVEVNLTFLIVEISDVVVVDGTNVLTYSFR